MVFKIPIFLVNELLLLLRVLLTCVIGAQIKVTTIKKIVWNKTKF